MTLRQAMKVLEKDAVFCGVSDINKYLGNVAMHRTAYPQYVLAAFDVWAEHIRRERDMER